MPSRPARPSLETVTEKRIRIEGIISTVRNVESDWGTTTKIRVETDEGWACWGALPAGCRGRSPCGTRRLVEGRGRDQGEAVGGDRVAFMARIEASAGDDKFEFFTRPTKGEIIARAEVEVAA